MKIYHGIHLYININSLNRIIKDDEGDHDNLCRTFHAVNTFTEAMEQFANGLFDVEVEKFTTSRLHFYMPENDDSDKMVYNMLELVAFAQELANHVNKLSKYQSLIDFKIGAGADYGKYTEFKFEDPNSEIEEMTTIGIPANQAAKLQALCANGKILISKEIYDILPDTASSLFYGDNEATQKLLKKYSITAYKADISNIIKNLGSRYNARASEGLRKATEIADRLNLKEMNVSDTNQKLDFTSLTIRNSKKLQNAAILFADIRGFTKKVNETNLSEIKQLTQIVLAMMNKEVRNRNGVHVQFQGDRESAVFNKYGAEDEDYALRAVLSAMRMVDKLEDINRIRKDEPLNIGIGCSLGETYATRIGMRGKKFNVIMGQTVKEADDAEDNVAGVGIRSNPTEIVLTEDLYNYLIGLPGQDGQLIKNNFYKRESANMIYYVGTIGFSEYQKKLVTYSQEHNTQRAKDNGGLKPWGSYIDDYLPTK